jgi:hypothetical protein
MRLERRGISFRMVLEEQVMEEPAGRSSHSADKLYQEARKLRETLTRLLEEIDQLLEKTRRSRKAADPSDTAPFSDHLFGS